jgi:hypothetical protein
MKRILGPAILALMLSATVMTAQTARSILSLLHEQAT